MRSISIASVALTLTLATPVAAQLRIVHDTLSSDTPTALSCGFCAGESFGVIFREIPGRRGLEPADFPLNLDAVEVGVAAASVPAGTCQREMVGGTIEAELAIYVGDTPPTGDITALPAVGEWSAGETLLWASDVVPLTLSVADAMGRYELNFNRLEIRDDMMAQIRVASGTYIRVVVTLPPGAPGSSSICPDPLEPPGGFPLRDDDGTILPERNFIYAGGAGWIWNEAVPGGGINGDWGVHLVIFPNDMPGTDAGVRTDGGATMSDGGSTGMDGGDAGTVDPPADGCSCRAAGSRAPSEGAPAGVLCLALIAFGARRLRGRGKLG